MSQRYNYGKLHEPAARCKLASLIVPYVPQTTQCPLDIHDSALQFFFRWRLPNALGSIFGVARYLCPDWRPLTTRHNNIFSCSGNCFWKCRAVNSTSREWYSLSCVCIKRNCSHLENGREKNAPWAWAVIVALRSYSNDKENGKLCLCERNFTRSE